MVLATIERPATRKADSSRLQPRDLPTKPARSVQMNVRIDANEKCEGDEVLARCGYTPSEAVRALWHYVAMYGDVPDFMRIATPEEKAAADEAYYRAARDGVGLAIKLAKQYGLLPQDYDINEHEVPDYKAMRDMAYDEWVEEMHASGELG